MMLKNRNLLYTREEPSRDAKLIIIYCEGKKREPQYFNYFSEISSRIRLEIEASEQHDNTSPMGLYDKAIKHIEEDKYRESDEIWFVIDTDSWGEHINTLRNNCKKNLNWSIAQSNPSFEVWLFYHLFEEFENFENIETPAGWKQYLNSKISGGFSSKKHPIFIEKAIINAKAKFDENLTIGSTEVFKLAEVFYPLVKDKIEDTLKTN